MTELLIFLAGAVSMFVALIIISVLITIKRRKDADKALQQFIESEDYKSLLQDFDKIWNDSSD